MGRDGTGTLIPLDRDHARGRAIGAGWMGLAILIFITLFRSARDRGLLLQVGE